MNVRQAQAIVICNLLQLLLYQNSMSYRLVNSSPGTDAAYTQSLLKVFILALISRNTLANSTACVARGV